MLRFNQEPILRNLKNVKLGARLKSSKLIIPILMAIGIIGLIYFGVVNHYKVCLECLNFKAFSAETVRHYIQGFGNWAILVYCLLYTANTFSPFFPPIFIMSLSAGALFGPLWGTAALTLGTFCGTTAAFFTARYFGRSMIEGLLKGKGQDLYKKLSENGFFILLPMRLVGFPPYGIIDFICGLSKMRYFDFITATMLGAVPWVILQVLLADRVTKFTGQFDLKTPATWIDPVLMGLLVVFVTMIVVTGKIVKNKQSDSDLGQKST